jgi:hypothetical protein
LVPENIFSIAVHGIRTEEVTAALAVLDDAVNSCMEGSQAPSADGVAQRDQESVTEKLKITDFFARTTTGPNAIVR